MTIKSGVFAATAAAALAMAAPPVHAGCSADVNNDEIVDVLDLLDVLTDWGPCAGCPSDVDGSGEVDVLDLLIVLTDWDKGCPQLAGKELASYPYFQFVDAFNEGSAINIAVDPSRLPVAGKTADIYVVEAKTRTEWLADTSLADVTGGYQTEAFTAGTIQDNTFTISGGEGLSADAGLGFGHPYDIVLDFNQNGALDAGDYIDGYDNVEHGMYAIHDISAQGPETPIEATYTCPNWDGTANYGGQNLFYPKNVSDMGELPLVIIGHGNGHQYIWYDHIGRHLASYGFIVMSHRNNTGPGPNAAALTTFEHTNIFIREIPNIAGGKLVGHVDTSKIIWVGHSRGGEGVAYAYDNIYDGTWTPTYFDIEDLQLVVSISPTDFYGYNETNPHEANFHLMYGASDSDVQGAPGSGSKPFSIYERGTGEKSVAYLQGCGHAWFHNGGGSSWATGPDLIGEAATHDVELGYFLALANYYTRGNVAARDFIQRMYDDIHPSAVPDNVIVAREFKHAEAEQTFIVDDYQTQTSTGTSSSGGSVTFDVTNVAEGLMIDTDGSFNYSTGVPFNGMTRSKNTLDKPRCAVFDWSVGASRYYELEVIGSESDFSDDVYLSFRACQGTRHPNTDALDAPLSFTATLQDADGTTSSIDFGEYGKISRTYKRTGYGTGAGWANEFNTVRIRLKDFTHNTPNLDLSDIASVRFDFGSAFGSDRGRIGIDDVEVTKE